MRLELKLLNLFCHERFLSEIPSSGTGFSLFGFRSGVYKNSVDAKV
jgi:hypothetical protein